ncbi:MAG: hypothetical protein JW955_05870 [Sedimentisphaerales bacterium]|nr:hypothetical protein [Sedimentisphaerales bacterium]
MSKRPVNLLLEDTGEAVERVARYTAGMSFEVFAQDEGTIDAAAREGLVFQEVSDHVEDRTVEHLEALLDGLTEVTLNGTRWS